MYFCSRRTSVEMPDKRCIGMVLLEHKSTYYCLIKVDNLHLNKETDQSQEAALRGEGCLPSKYFPPTSLRRTDRIPSLQPSENTFELYDL